MKFGAFINRQIGKGRMRLVGVALSVLLPTMPVEAESAWYYTAFGGVLTEGAWHDAINPNTFDLADAGLLGVGIGWQRRIGSTFLSLGVEAQAVRHFGRQDHFEFNLPIIARYAPEPASPSWITSTAFGLGLSYATKVPQVEIDRSGASQRKFFYWLAEVEFALPDPEANAFLRLHHRSDGFGYFDTDSGSTAIVFGWRKRF